MFCNPYVLPHLLGLQTSRLDIWHGSSTAEPSYLEWIPKECFALWTEKDRRWASQVYYSQGFQADRERYVEIRTASVAANEDGPTSAGLI